MIACDGASDPPSLTNVTPATISTLEEDELSDRTSPTPSMRTDIDTPPSTPTNEWSTGPVSSTSTPTAQLNISITLTLNSPIYILGENIEMTITITNQSEWVSALSFNDSQRFDFVVTDGQEQEIWRWSSGLAFSQVTGEEKILPSASLTYTETWNQGDSRGKQVNSGEYALSGIVVGCIKEAEICHPLESTLSLHILPDNSSFD